MMMMRAAITPPMPLRRQQAADSYADTIDAS